MVWMWKEGLVYKTLNVYSLHYLGAGKKRNGDKGMVPRATSSLELTVSIVAVFPFRPMTENRGCVFVYLCPQHGTLYMFVERVDEQMRNMDFGASSRWP